MQQYARAASEPKLVLWYDTGHGLNEVRALMDRANWLRRYLGMKPVTPIVYVIDLLYVSSGIN